MSAAAKARPIVLFLCTGNSARSQMAEGLLRHLAGDRFEAHSAGVVPRPIHPLTHRVMAEIGIDTTAQRSKDLRSYLGRVSVRHAIIVCENAQQHCPSVYPFALETLYWPFDDPTTTEGSEAAQLEEFRAVRDQIGARIRLWLDQQAPD